MQQYRFNFPLFIGLVVGTLVSSTAVYGLWKFQINRKSGWLLSEAEKANEANNPREAAQYYQQYRTIDPDNEDIRLKYAVAMSQVLKLDDITPIEFQQALSVLETTVRSQSLEANPETKKLRRQLAELYGRDDFKRYQDALEHIGYLLQTDPDDADLQALRATYLARSGDFDKAITESYKLVGYDPESDEFDAKKATAPGHVDLYTNLAVTLRTRQDKKELADRVMDQLIETNPKSAEAHLARGRYQLSIDNVDEARAEYEEAYKLKPDDAVVLLSMVEMAARDEQYDKAAEYVATGKKLFPNDVRFYRTAAGIYMKQEQFDKAIAEVNDGIGKVKENDKVHLLIYKVELLLAQDDLDATRKTLDDLERTAKNIRPVFLDYYRARVMLAEGNWQAAKTALNKIRPQLAEMTGGQTIEVDGYLGLCYEKLGQPDLAAEAYRAAVAQNPNFLPAKAGLERVEALKGTRELTEEDRQWQKLIMDIMKKPKAERDFAPLEKLLDKIATDNKWDDLTKKTRQAQLKSMAEDYTAARTLLVEAQKLAPENIGVRKMLIQIVRTDPKLGPEKAQQLLDRTVKELGDLPSLRVEKADNIIAQNAGKPNKEELIAELAAVTEGIDGWTADQKAELWGGMAGRFLNLGLNEQGRQYLTLAADLRPDDLPLCVNLFSLAMEANDDTGMKNAQDRILKVVGSTEDNVWLFTEARRKLALLRRGQLDPKAIDEIRPLVTKALEQRKDWHELYVLNGELELAAGNLPKALENFDRAQELGRPYPAATAQHIKLLSLAGNIKRAGELLERIPESLRFPLLGQLYPEILFRTNRVDDALKEARDAIAANPNNAQSHYWYGQLLARSAQTKTAAADPAKLPADTQSQLHPANAAAEPDKQVMAQAISEMRKAIELQPEFPDAWGALIYYYMVLKDAEQAQAVLRESQLTLSGDNLQIFLARSYEALGRWFDAETIYRSRYESAPDDLPRTQQLAAFYLGNVYQQPDRNLKVTPLLNKILKAGAEKKIRGNDPGLLWARRMGAKMLANTGDYQSLLKAEKLLASNSQNGELTIDDKLAMARILADRPEPEHRQKAIQLLESVAEVQALDTESELALGTLYYLTKVEWRKYVAQMRKAILKDQNSLAARAAFAKTLIERGDKQSLDEAANHVKKMREISPNHVATFELTVRLASKLGRQADARKHLLGMLPNLTKVTALSVNDRQLLGMMAGLLIELQDLDNAEKIYRKVAEVDPAQNLTLAKFLGNYRNVDQCFQKLNEIYNPQIIPAIAEAALTVVRKQREKVGDKFDAQIQTWLDTGLRENPDSVVLLMDQADLYDIQKRYDDAAAVYQKLLERKDLVGLRRAIVLNNLSFLAALAGPKAKVNVDPLKLVEEAKDIMGPNSDILDTRAVVFIAKKRYDEAIEDLELSVTDNPTASKYFHKAHAHLEAGENLAAVDAWKKAENLGLNHDAINLMEIELFDKLKVQIDQLRSSITQAEALRPAG